MLSITGLDTATPLMKVEDTVLRGRRMDLFGSEIVLVDEFDPTKPKGKQHRLQPLPPSTCDSQASAASSSTRKRILFRPIYDPISRDSASASTAALQALRKLVQPSSTSFVALEKGKQKQTTDEDRQGDARLASVANLLNPQGREAEKGVGRGKYKRKEVSEEEQLIRAAERKVRKAAKEFRKQQMEEQEAAASASQEPVQEQSEPSRDMEEEIAREEGLQEPRPPPSFHEQH